MTPESADPFQIRMHEEIQSAGPTLQSALMTMRAAPPEQAAGFLQRVIPKIRESSPAWAGTAECCLAWCLHAAGRFQEAIVHAEEGRRNGLNASGEWYYHEVVGDSLNQLDDLEGALEAIERAIRYFEQYESSMYVAHHLARKANVLKQVAFHHSTDSATYGKAREPLIQALQALADSVRLDEPLEGEWKRINDELNGISRIAARIGIPRHECLSIFEPLDEPTRARFSKHFVSLDIASPEMAGRPPMHIGKGPSNDRERVSSNSPVAQPGTGKQGSDGRCWIASAVYGADSAEVAQLREFRDMVLLRSRSGRGFVIAYYSVAPFVAWLLVRVPALGSIVERLLLRPVLYHLRERMPVHFDAGRSDSQQA